MLKQSKRRARRIRLCTRKKMQKISVFHFPRVEGLEDVSAKLDVVAADSVFSALMHGFALRSIDNEKDACEAERVLEYLDRVFEGDCPSEVDQYRNVLQLLIADFDEKHYQPAIEGLAPHEFLAVLLKETGLKQKDLVPNCFKSASQASEFLSQRKGRGRLSFSQAKELSKLFHVDPTCFLPSD